MSEARLIALRDALRHEGWEVEVPAHAKRPFKFLFTVENERIHWPLRHRITGKQLELSFWLLAVTGAWTSDVRDVWNCQVVDHSPRLDFGKINSDKWRHDLEGFVRAVSALSKMEETKT